MKKQLYIIFSTIFFFAVVSGVSAATPPNSPKQLTPAHNATWSDSQAFSPGDITFTWENNGDPDDTVESQTPLWFYFYLIKWNGSVWAIHTTTYTSAVGITIITRNLTEGSYAWQVAAVDATQSSSPWHAWADRNEDGMVTSADWSYVKVKGSTGDTGEIGATEAPTTCGTTIKHICISAICPGGEARDYSTIQAFADAALPGWTGQLQNGTYAENVTIFRNGTAANPICLRAKPGHSPVLEKTNALTGTTAISFANASNPIPISYWIIEGLEIRGYPSNGIWLRGIGTNHITMRKNHIHHVGGHGGIQVRGAGGQILIEDNIIEEVSTVKLDGVTKMPCPAFPDSNQHCHAIYFGDGPGDTECTAANLNNTIRRNYLRRAPGAGIQFRYTNCSSSSPAKITNSLVENNVIIDSGNGFNVGGKISNNVFRNNTIILTNNAPPRDVTWRALWNTTNTVANNKVFNNIFYASGDDIWAFNIQNDFPFDTNDFNYNIWTGMSDTWRWLGTSRSDFNINYQSVTGWDANGKIGVDPKFVSSSNFHLQLSSPARNAGLNAQCASIDFDGVSRPQEITCDIGAYEYQP